MKELLIIKEPLSLIVTVSTSCSLICSPTTPLALSPSVPLSCALSCSILPPLTCFLTQSRKKIRNVPQLIFFPVHVFQTAFSLINWGKWLRTSAPGPVPYIPFSFASMSSALASYLSSRGFTSPSPSSPFPFLLFFFPPLHSPLLPLHALCPQNLGALEDSLVQYPWSLLPSPFRYIVHCTYHPIHHSSIALPHLILDKENGLVLDRTDLAPLLKWRPIQGPSNPRPTSIPKNFTLHVITLHVAPRPQPGLTPTRFTELRAQRNTGSNPTTTGSLKTPINSLSGCYKSHKT